MIAEVDVALTDYGLAAECALFVWLLARRPGAPGPLRAWLVIFFGAGAAAALLGGTVHGFFPDGRGPDAALLWALTLVAIGASALAAWGVGARLLFAPRVACTITTTASVALVGYAAIVALVSDAFAVAVVGYLPSLLFLVVALAVEYRRTRARPVLGALGGLVLMLGGAWVQQRGIALHPVYLTHNAVYHVIQAAGLLLVYRGGAWLLGERDR